jgi:hypothetical protein
MYPLSSGTNKSSKSSSTNSQNQNNYQQQQQQHTLNDTFSNLFQLNQFNLFNTNTNNLFFPPFTPPTAPHVRPSTAPTHATPKQKKSKESQKSQQSADHHHHGSNKSLAIDPLSANVNMNNSNNSSFDLFNFYQNQLNANLNDFLMNPTLLAAAASAPPTTPSQTIQTTPYSVRDLIEPSKQQNPSQSHINMQQGSLYDLNLWTAMLQTAAASLFAPQSMQQQQQQLESQGQLDRMQLNQFYNMNQLESKPSSKAKTTTTTTTAVHQTNDNHTTTNTGNAASDEIKKNDVAKIKYPLKLKWRRETIVKEIHKNGIRGDVIYYSPCGKKLRTFQEIERYLLKHNIKNLCRDNFTFSSKYIVGVFLLPVVQKHHDQAATSQTSNYKIYNEDQIVMKIKEVNPHFSRKSTTTAVETNLVSATNLKKMKTSPTEGKEIKIQKAAMHEQKLQRQEQQLHERQKQLQQEQQLQNELLIKQQQQQQTIAAANLQLEQKRLVNERKIEERQEQSERKVKEKWFESIVSREFKKQIDDMQERFLVDLPTFKEIPQQSESKVKIEIKIENECSTEQIDDKSKEFSIFIECKRQDP